MYKNTFVAAGQRTTEWLNQAASSVADQGSSTPIKSSRETCFGANCTTSYTLHQFNFQHQRRFNS